MNNKTVLSAALVLLLSGGLTFLSLGFVRPVTCLEACDIPEPLPCLPQACRFYEQRAGLPLPVVIDSPGGGSPTMGWRKLGPEDMPNPFTFLMEGEYKNQLRYFHEPAVSRHYTFQDFCVFT